MNDIYEIEDRRSFVRRLIVSGVLAVAIGVLLALAIAAVQLGPRFAPLLGGPAIAFGGTLVSWIVGFALMIASIKLVITFAPASRREIPLLGVTTVLVALAWLIASLLFAAFAVWIAEFTTIYGSFAIAIVLMTYLYVSAGVFVGALQIDALAKAHGKGSTSPRGD